MGQFFKATKLELAKRLYKDAMDLLDVDNEELKEEQKSEMKKLKATCYSNTALIQIKSKDWSDALQSCNDGLKLEASNPKLIFRRAQCYDNRDDTEEALADLK